MRTNNLNYTATTLVSFKIGRGGRFYNPGHLSFLRSEEDIFYGLSSDIFEQNRDAKGRFCKTYITDLNGSVLMDAEEYAEAISSGTGRLDFDGQYCTYYTCKLADCSDAEADAILSAMSYDTDSLIAAMVEIGVISEDYLEEEEEEEEEI